MSEVRDVPELRTDPPFMLSPAQLKEITHHGVVLRVREDIDVAHLARLVAALAGTAPC